MWFTRRHGTGRPGRSTRGWLPMLLVVSLFSLALAPRAARASLAVSASGSSGTVGVSLFYDDLQPYGRWVDEPSYGHCWVPGGVAADWRPYSYGHWVYTDFGWTWVSDEPWGWATYHYGRWFDDPGYGWVWVPGSVWGPAWVDWRWSDDCVGWAPLPPQAGWSAWGGLSFHDATVIPARGWCFVEPRAFVSADLRTRVFPVARNQEFFRRTRDITRIETRGGRPMNPGIAVASIEQRTGRRVERLNVVDVSSPARGRGQFRNRESIGFYRPAVRREPGRMPEMRGGSPGRGNETVIRAPRSNPREAAGGQRQEPTRSIAQNRWQRQEPARQAPRGPEWQRQTSQQAQRQDRWQRQQAPQQPQQQDRWQRQQAPQQAQRQDRGQPQRAPSEPRMTQRRPDQGARAPQARPQGDHGREKDKGKGDRG